MITTPKALLPLAVMLALGGCQPQVADKAAPVDQVEAQVPASYAALAQAYFDDTLALSPVMATFVGQSQYNDQFGNNLTDDYLERRHQHNKSYLAKLLSLDWSTLSEQERLSAEVLKYELEMALKDEEFPGRFLPLNQFYSRVFTLVQLGTGDSAQPFDTVQDYDNFISRIQGFSEWVDTAIARMAEGAESKVVLPRILVQRILPQLDAQLGVPVEQTPFAKPLLNLPEGLSEAQSEALAGRYRQTLDRVLFPAMQKLRDYLGGEYLAQARGSHGWRALPNGADWYQQLANQNTTTTMPVDEIHQLGLAEVARIRAEMEQVRERVGFEGDLTAFFEHLGNDPQFFFEDKQQLIDGYTRLKARINAVLGEFFAVMPEADYVVKPVEAFRERSAAGASYQAPAPDGSRPGVFYINTYNLKAQPKWGMTTLSLHEAAPGHHFQIALKQELDDVPDFQRFGGYTAFAEGWALYAEYLGVEMGLFEDPYQYFGKLSDEMLRAMRLVVDTGLHAKGWSREQAIQYMLDNSPMAESDVTAEVERYMAIPGQALSYKVGQLAILDLRAEAEQALGDEFDIKAFHHQVLSSGSLPMAVLEMKVRAWISAQQG